MGYRSDVLIRVNTHPPEKFKEIYLKLMLVQPPWIKEIEELRRHFQEFTFDGSELLIYLNSWKWYDSYEDVGSCNTAIEYFEKLAQDMSGEEDFSINTCFLRLGEDITDIEERYENDGWDLGRVTRDIEIQ